MTRAPSSDQQNYGVGGRADRSTASASYRQVAVSVSKQQVNGFREHLQDCSKAIGRYAKGVSKHKVNAQELRHQRAIGRSKVLAGLVSTA